MAQKQQTVKRYTISIRKGDNVRVMAGKDAGKSGRVLSVNPRKNTVIVEHANSSSGTRGRTPRRISRAASWRKKQR